MLNRRAFAVLLGGAAAIGPRAWAQERTSKTVFYSSTGRAFTRYEVDPEAATLTRRETVMLPANAQYAWPHPSSRYLYVVSSNGEPGGGDAAKGDTHRATAFTIDPGTGALSPHGDGVALVSRPIHTSVDRSGRFLMIAYNDPSNLTVHRLNGDGTIGGELAQREKPDAGIFAHQIRTIPSNRSAVLVTRGNNPTANRAEDPGALKVFAFDDGQLTKRQSLAPNKGYGFGPRHLDFHPTLPFVYVSLERQNKLYVYGLNPDGTLSADALFRKDSLADPAHAHSGQGAGTLHFHPNGRFLYQANRNSSLVDFRGTKVFAGGENTIAAWSIDQKTGEPTLIQNADGHANQLRTFGLDSSGRMLVAASVASIPIRDGDRIANLTAGLTVYRIGDDGKLTFARKYDVDTSQGTQFWSGMVTLA